MKFTITINVYYGTFKRLGISGFFQCLAIKYESEWYADDSLSKWNELDVFYQKKREEKRQSIFDELAKAGITQPDKKEHACAILDKNFKCKMDEWQIEKEHRIKPSLWWREVADAQVTQTDSPTEPVLSKLPANGKVWHLHPVGMGVFKNIPKKITIIIDPGHGYTMGSTGAAARIYKYKAKNNTIIEANSENLPETIINNTNLIIFFREDHNRSERGLVYDVSIKLKKLLEDQHFNVILTRTERVIQGKDDAMSRKARIDLANNNNADYFISIHADGALQNDVSGSHVIYPNVSNEEVVNLSRELAEDIFNYYTVVPVEPSSPKQDDRGLQVLKDSNKTKRKVLIELGFVTSPKDANSLFSNINRIAQQLYDGLLKNINKYN